MNSLTSKEASEKWCPAARVLTYASEGESRAAFNRTTSAYSIPESARCLGADCMAWRWQADGLGYCGLAR